MAPPATGTRYPTDIDDDLSLRAVTDGIDSLLQGDHNALKDAIIAIENKLGTTNLPGTGLADGNVATPGIRFVNEPGTGLFRAVPSSISLGIGGVEVYRAIQGAIGLGTATPFANLDIIYPTTACVFQAYSPTGDARIISSGSTGGAIDLVHRSATANERWWQISSYNGYLILISMNDSGVANTEIYFTKDGDAGFGTASPRNILSYGITGKTLQVYSSGQGAAVVNASGAADLTLVDRSASVDNRSFRLRSLGAAVYIDRVTDTGTGVNLFKLDANGQLTTQHKAAFAGIKSATQNVTGTTATVTFPELFDNSGSFDSNTTFTAPVTGRYQLNLNLAIITPAVSWVFRVRVVTNARTYLVVAKGGSDNRKELVSWSHLVDMSAGHTAYVTLEATGTNPIEIIGSSTEGQSMFSGFLAS